MRKTFVGCLLMLALPAWGASFDCQKATTTDEKAICANRTLNDKDVEMATTYRLLTGLFAMGARGAMQDQQRQWLTSRHQCGADVPCLNRRYDERLRQLDAIYGRINKPL